MKFVVFAAVGLSCMTASVAQAQSPAAPPPAPAAPAPPQRSCMLVTQINGKYLDIPLAGFDPAVTSAPLPPVTATGAIMVVCNRATVIPEVTDYRVLTELRLPLSIRAGQKTVFLGASDGKLQAGMPQGEATPEDTAALSARLDQMEAAMQAKPAKK